MCKPREVAKASPGNPEMDTAEANVKINLCGIQMLLFRFLNPKVASMLESKSFGDVARYALSGLAM